MISDPDSDPDSEPTWFTEPVDLEVVGGWWNLTMPRYAETNVYDELVAKYSEPHRAYHTLTHVVQCLEGFRWLSANRPEYYRVDREIVCTALWVHDVVYDIGTDEHGATNEGKSAGWFHTRSQFLRSKPYVDKVTWAIFATRHGADDYPAKTLEEQVVCDMDLLSLAAPPSLFKANSEAIRREYAGVPDDLFYPGRKKILGSFLERDSIYQTPFVRNRMEERARKNLTELLEGA